MSRAYQIRVSETVVKTVHIEDGLSFRLEILDVLGKERMAALLTEELRGQGYEEGEDGKLVKKVGDVEVAVDPSSGTVEVRLDATETIEKAGSKRGMVYDPEKGREVMANALKSRLSREVDEDAEAIRAELTAELEKRLPGVRAELDRVANKVTAAALKEKARQMGEIEELSEDETTGELTIRVRV